MTQTQTQTQHLPTTTLSSTDGGAELIRPSERSFETLRSSSMISPWQHRRPERKEWGYACGIPNNKENVVTAATQRPYYQREQSSPVPDLHPIDTDTPVITVVTPSSYEENPMVGRDVGYHHHCHHRYHHQHHRHVSDAYSIPQCQNTPELNNMIMMMMSPPPTVRSRTSSTDGSSSSSTGSCSSNSNSSTSTTNSYQLYSPTTHAYSSLRRRHFFPDQYNPNIPQPQTRCSDDDMTSNNKLTLSISKHHNGYKNNICYYWKKFDLFPKVERDCHYKSSCITDYNTTKEHGMSGAMIMKLLQYFLIVLLMGTEVCTWVEQNNEIMEHVFVDTRLGKKMRININITFPSLACSDLHVDAVDVAGNTQFDVDDTLVKLRLRRDGTALSKHAVRVETNMNHRKYMEAERAKLHVEQDEYCGECYGAQKVDGQCCNTCDDVVNAYIRKGWDRRAILERAEQCIREGRSGTGMKPLTKGEGCNLSGYMNVNRVSGNFHIAMGEGIERNGRHIHQFKPEDAIHFNSSHIIHELSFGPKHSILESGGGLNGMQKVTTEESGPTGLFQYFMKVVPTTYRGERMLETLSVQGDTKIIGRDFEPFVETNHYSFTERFRPFMSDLINDEHKEFGREDGVVGVSLGGDMGGSYSLYEHHKVENSVLPGVFFMYEIHPFAVEVTKKNVPSMHLLIRLIATFGGVITIFGWVDSLFTRKHIKLGKA